MLSQCKRSKQRQVHPNRVNHSSTQCSKVAAKRPIAYLVSSGDVSTPIGRKHSASSGRYIRNLGTCFGSATALCAATEAFCPNTTNNPATPPNHFHPPRDICRTDLGQQEMEVHVRRVCLAGKDLQNKERRAAGSHVPPRRLRRRSWRGDA